MHTWITNETTTALDDIPAMSRTDPTYIEKRLENTDFVVQTGTVGYLEGYIVPTLNGSFMLQIKGDTKSQCKTKISTSADPANAVSNRLISGF